MRGLCLNLPAGEDVDTRVLCEQNPKQELYTEVQFLPTSVPHNAGAVFERSGKDGGKALDKRVLCEQNPKQELYKDVQFLLAYLQLFRTSCRY